MGENCKEAGEQGAPQHTTTPCTIRDPTEAQDTVGWRRERRESEKRSAHVWVHSQRS